VPEINSVLLDSLYPEGLFSISPSPTIILDHTWETASNAEKMLLEKILTAIKQSFNSVTIKYQDSLDLSTWSVKPSRVIYFGKSMKGIPLYEPVEANGVTIIASESLKDLLNNEPARKQLWQALKKQFSV
jgi:DNA polymerase III psi subunit